MNDAGDLLSDARAYMIGRAVYFSSCLLNLIPYATEEVETFGVTPGMVMYYNPKYVLHLASDVQREDGVKRIATRLWHEVQHVLRETWARCEGVDHRTANLGADLAINSSGRHSNDWDFGPDGVLPKQYKFEEDLTMEEYVVLLLKNAPKHPKPGCGAGQCGGTAGNPGNKELEDRLDGEFGRSQLDKILVQKQVALDILDHLKNGKLSGTMPGGWKEWAEAMLAPSKVPWHKEFHAVFRSNVSKIEAGCDEYSMARPSRRTFSLADGIILPSLVENEIELALCLDTSASMRSDTEIALALREARVALMRSGCETAWFLEVDTDLGCKPRRVRVKDLLKIDIHGRGGTDFRPAFVAAEKLVPKPAMLVYLTDGYGPAPSKKPKDMEVIWCLVGPNTVSPATWGRVIHVKE